MSRSLFFNGSHKAHHIKHVTFKHSVIGARREQRRKQTASCLPPVGFLFPTVSLVWETALAGRSLRT